MNFFNVIRTSKYLRIIYLNLPRGIRKRYIEFRALKHGKWTKTKIHKRQLEGLEALRNIHEGDTCVLMANGPSLKSTDWGLLKSLDIPIIGLNRIGMIREEMGFDPDYLVVIKDLVIRQFSEDILQINSKKFVDFDTASTMKEFENAESLFMIGSRLSMDPDFSRDLNLGWYRGYTVTYAALQVIYYLGFKKVLLIGLDHYFITPGQARRNVISQGNDENHFHKDYFGKGIKWALPDLDGSERYYAVARRQFEADGRSIIDCTKNGKCTIFEKGEFLEELGSD